MDREAYAMVKKIIYVPSIGDSPVEFAKLFEIAHGISNGNENICINFSQCKYLRPNAVAFIGGLARLIELQKRTISFDWESLNNSSLRDSLSENGFTTIFKHSLKKTGKHSIPYREDKNMVMNNIMDYLVDDWLGRGWVQVSMSLRNAIAGKMWEIYNNAFEHSKTPVGVFSCGQHFSDTDELILSVVDFGQGIPIVVRNFLSKKDRRAEKLKDSSCLDWAFRRGNSTCSGEVARGLGLDLLKEFVVLNGGKLEVYSNKCYVIIDKDGARYRSCDGSFSGTIFHITLRCDESLYTFEDEFDPNFQEVPLWN